MHKKSIFKAIVAIAVALAFVTPVAAVANVGTFGVTSNVENADDIENTMEIFTNSGPIDNIETTIDDEKSFIEPREDPVIDTEELSIVNDNIIVSSTGVTWYVGSGPGNDSATIQGGVDLAGAGDTVYVYDGTYNECGITVDKQLDLVGESREGVIVDGGGDPYTDVFYITTSAIKVNIDTFTVTNGGKNGIRVRGPYTNITNCNIYDNKDDGIYIRASSYNNIMNCDIYENNDGGIWFQVNSAYNTITNCNIYNHIYSHAYGIQLTQSPNSKLEGNALYNNGMGLVVNYYFNQDIDPSNTIDGRPIYYLVGQSNLELNETHNFGYLGLVSCTNITVKNVDVSGILLAGTTGSTISNVSSHDTHDGIHLSSSSGNTIINCSAYNNYWNGILLGGSSNNHITNCTVYENDQQGINICSSSHNNIITNCTAYNHTYNAGIYIFIYSSSNDVIDCDLYDNVHGIDIDSNANNNDIINCNVYNNVKYGIRIRRLSSGNTITNSIVYNNERHGFWIERSANNNNIMNCDVYNNLQIGILIEESTNIKLRDNTIYDNGDNFIVDGSTLDHFNQDIDATNTINGKPVCYLFDYHDFEWTEIGDLGYLGLIFCTNVTVKNLDVASGVVVINTTQSTISNVSSHNGSNGIYLWMSSYNTITNCDAFNNTNYGTVSYDTAHGIYLKSSSDNTITNCNAYNNLKNGIYFDESSSNNIITDCNVYNTTGHTYFTGHGIYLMSSTIVTNCNVYDNNDHGIVFSASSNTITNCSAYNNAGHGIYLTSSNIVTNCSAYGNNYGLAVAGLYNTITNCNMYNNEYGIVIGKPENILRDNTIYDNTYNFIVDVLQTSWFYQDIDASNTVNGKPIYYLIEQENVTLDGSAKVNIGFLAMIFCTNMTVKNLDVCGILVIGTTDSTISNVSTHNSLHGIHLWSSSGNTITNCDLYHNSFSGILLLSSSGNTITNCDAYNNTKHGIYIWSSSNNNITNCNAYNHPDKGIYIGYSTNIKLRDNTIYDNGDGFSVYGESLSSFIHDIDISNTLNGKLIYYLIENSNLELNETHNVGYIGIISCTNITAKNLDVNGILIVDTVQSTISNINFHNNSNKAIHLYQSSDNTIRNCNVYNNWNGIYLKSSSDNTITNCHLYNNTYTGIYLDESSNNYITRCTIDNCNFALFIVRWSFENIITDCNIYNNYYAVWIEDDSEYNLIYHNNFVNNDYLDDCPNNMWDNGYPSGGNYWDIYDGVDVCSGPGQNEPGSDGIGDTPFEYEAVVDGYPLMNMWIPSSIADVVLTTSDPMDTDPLYGWEKITCTITDDFAVDEVKLVVTYPDSSTVEYPMIKDGDIYSCNTTFTDAGDYTYHVWANDTNDNIAESEPEAFVLPPNYEVDMDGNRVIGFWDIMAVAGEYGNTGPGYPSSSSFGWIREDVDNDGAVGFWDIMAVAGEYGKSW